jgi:hypothetical protein
LVAEEERAMDPPADPPDETDDGQLVPDYSPKTLDALFSALESVEADVSPQLVRSVQATINAVKRVRLEFGFLTAGEARDVLGPEHEGDAEDFALRYRGQELYPRFLFEPSPSGAGPMRVRPLMQDLKTIADGYGWDGEDVIYWMTSPTTWFADGSRPVDHLDQPARVLAAFEDEAGAQW